MKNLKRVSIFGLAAQLAFSAFGDDKPSHKKMPAPAIPKIGIKTPGIQIPFSKLKAEAEFQTPDKPDWIFVTSGPTGAAFIPAKNSIDKIDLKTNKKGDPIPTLDQPCGGMVSAFNSLWTPVCGAHSLVRLDAKTLKVTATIHTGTSGVRGTIASSTDSIWILTDDKTTLSRIDPDQNAVVGETRVPADCRGLILAEASLWLACPSENKVLRINPASNLVDQSIKVSEQPISIAAGAGSLGPLPQGREDRPHRSEDQQGNENDRAGGSGRRRRTRFRRQLPLGDADWLPAHPDRSGAREGKRHAAVQRRWRRRDLYSPGAIWLSNLKAGRLAHRSQTRAGHHSG